MDIKNNKFNRIYEDYKKLIMKVAANRLRCYDAAQEICQITFMEYYIKMETIEEEFIKPWLMLVARNTTIDYLRKRNVRLLRQEGIEAAEVIDYEVVYDHSAERIVRKIMSTELVYSILYELKALNPIWYELIVNIGILDRQQVIVAREMNITLSVLRARLYRARCWLRERFGDDYELCKQ
jgi:RNA polymerase sigma factor, sigma-70 family